MEFCSFNHSERPPQVLSTPATARVPFKGLLAAILGMLLFCSAFPALLHAQPVPGAVGGQITPSQGTGVFVQPGGATGLPLPGMAPSEGTQPEKKTEAGAFLEEELPPEEESAIERLLSGEIPAAVSTKLKQFGYALFRRRISTFAPVTDVPVGPDYIIGPGDSFIVTLWGKAEGVFPVEVNRAGEIILPKVGAIKVWGLTLAQLREVVQAGLRRYYPEFHMNISMNELRAIRVFVVGETATPGSYSLSSLSTMVNALFACGGPSKTGSLRQVQLIRNGKTVNTLDLYDFLLRGDKGQDARLEAGDTIFIPVIGKVAGIAGNVKRPAIYEMKGAMSIGRLIKLAGGVTPGGYLQRVQIERMDAHKKKIVLDLNLSPTMPPGDSSISNTPLQDGDMVKIYPIISLTQDIVYLEGHVVRPDGYELKSGMKLSDLITSFEDLLPEPHLDYADILRLEGPDSHEKIIPFNLGGVLKKTPEHDLNLQRLDRVKVYSKWDFEDGYQVSIEGEVRRPKKLNLLEKMRVSDLVQRAGGLTKEAYLAKAEIFRLTPGRGIETVAFDLGKALEGDKEADIILQDEDRVVVHNIWETKWKETVHVVGQVNKPGEYRLTQGMRVGDLIFRSGGFKDNAYLKEAELTRQRITPQGLTTERMEINLERAMAGDEAHSLILQKYDTLKVRIIPEWRGVEAVTIKGKVRFPGQYTLKKGETLSSVIRRAGGYTSEAYLRGAVFTRESIKEKQRQRLEALVEKQEQEIQTTSALMMELGALGKQDIGATTQSLALQQELLKKLKAAKITGRVVVKLTPLDEFSGSEYDLKLEAEDELFIPVRPSTVDILGEVYNPTALLYRKNKTVSHYLEKVGGPTENAEDEQVYLIMADGSVISRSQLGGWGISWDSENNRWVSAGFMNTKLEPGDTILVPRKLARLQWLQTTSLLTQILYQIAIAAGVTVALFL